MHLRTFISILLYAFLHISRMLVGMAYYTSAMVTFTSKHTLNLVMRVIMVIENLLLAFVPTCLGGGGGGEKYDHLDEPEIVSHFSLLCQR